MIERGWHLPSEPFRLKLDNAGHLMKQDGLVDAVRSYRFVTEGALTLIGQD